MAFLKRDSIFLRVDMLVNDQFINTQYEKKKAKQGHSQVKTRPRSSQVMAMVKARQTRPKARQGKVIVKSSYVKAKQGHSQVKSRQYKARP